MTIKTYCIYRKPVLMEDEGRYHYIGQIKAKDTAEAAEKAADKFGSGYFHPSDFDPRLQ